MVQPSSIYPMAFSRIQVFEQCELRFDRQYVTADVKDRGGEASRYGNRLHEAFEDYLIKGASLPPEFERFRGLLDKLKSMPGVQFYEHQMAVTVDKEPCAWDASDCWFRGIADFAVVNGTAGFAGDWKSGKPKDDTFQLLLMAALMFEHHPELHTVNTKYFWLFHPTAPSTPALYHRHDLPDMWGELERKIEKVEQALQLGVFVAKPSGLCSYCPAYDTCEFARRRRR